MTWYGGPIDVSDDVEKFSDDRLVVAFERAVREFGGYVVDYDSPEFKEEFAKQLCYMVADDSMSGLVRKGFVDPRVQEDGTLAYRLTDEGREMVEDV